MIYPTQAFIKFFKSINGAFSVTEAIALYNILSEVKEGVYVELGVAHGKSATVAMDILPKGTFHLVDPEFEQMNHIEDVAFKLRMVSMDFLLCFNPMYSTDFLVKPPGSYDQFSYVMVDSGSHQDGLPLAEVKLLEDRMIEGGIMAFHDYQSQFSEV